ncbi:hypothetical protein FRB99_006976 [Tulasnella sp. 403]|nr:hypothetical protein FRB99_006976 [Tulasnella sp. 403]
MHLTHDSNWEVVDQKQVPQVPAYYDDSQIQVTSISSQDISHTYYFDGPSSSRSSTSSGPSSPSLKSKLLKPPGSPSFGFRLSRSPSPSSYDEDDYPQSPNLFRDPRDFTPAQARDALTSARTQLLGSSEMRKLGANVLFSEGWVITKLRKGNKFRLQVQYTARPAKAIIQHGASKASLVGLPPFMDLLEGSW